MIIKQESLELFFRQYGVQELGESRSCGFSYAQLLVDSILIKNTLSKQTGDVPLTVQFEFQDQLKVTGNKVYVNIEYGIEPYDSMCDRLILISKTISTIQSL